MKTGIINILGRGGSLKDFDFSLIEGDVMAVNHLPEVDNLKHVVYWDPWAYEKIKDTDATIHSIEINKGKCDVCYKNRGSEVNLNAGEVGNINLSGWMAINVALHLGYTEIYLFGYDGGNQNGTHYDNDVKDHRDDSYKRYNDKFEMFKGLADIHNVVNPYKPSNLVCFPNITFDEYEKRICERLDRCVIVDIDDVLPSGGYADSQTDDSKED